MQTFLPYQSFTESAKCLDNKRLGKQRVEAWQILRIVAGMDENSRWRNHPAVLMWGNYEIALAVYGMEICNEWIKRGYNDSLRIRFYNHLMVNKEEELNKPNWFGLPDFHSSHRSNLLRKDPIWYGKFNWTEPPDLPYVWPVRKEN